MITDAKKPKKLGPSEWESVFDNPFKNAPEDVMADVIGHAMRDHYDKRRKAANAVDKSKVQEKFAMLSDGFHPQPNPYWVIARFEGFRRSGVPRIRDLDGPNAGKVLRHVRKNLGRGTRDAIDARKLESGGLLAYLYKGYFTNSRKATIEYDYETKPRSEWDNSLRAQIKEIRGRLCDWCGKSILSDTRPNQRYCSERCKETAKKSRQRRRRREFGPPFGK